MLFHGVELDGDSRDKERENGREISRGRAQEREKGTTEKIMREKKKRRPATTAASKEAATAERRRLVVEG